VIYILLIVSEHVSEDVCISSQ